MNLDRRTLLVGGGVGVGLVVAYALWPSRLDSDLPLAAGERGFGNFIKIARDGRITVAVPQTETGQGIWTALPQIVADELGAAWETIAVEPAPLTKAYANPLAEQEGWFEGFGRLRAYSLSRDGAMRITAGSTSVRAFELPIREAAAVARAMLLGTAADRWNVSTAECEIVDGLIMLKGQSFTFGELSEEAANRSPPRHPEFRNDQQARLIGKPLARLDGPAKASGSWRFAGDVRLPNMLFAAARLAPPGGRLRSFSEDAVRAVSGVRNVTARDGWIAISADDRWTAERAMKAAKPIFSGPRTPTDFRPILDELVSSGKSQEWFAKGDYDGVTRNARALAATYYVAPSEHFSLEPITATARVANGTVELWSATQAPSLMAGDASLYPMPVGAPSGSAMDNPAASIAIDLAKTLGRPVQVMLAQSASQNHRSVSPGALARMTALPDPAGMISAWQMRVATADGMGSSLAGLTGTDSSGDLGATALDGAIPPYSFPNLRIQALRADLPIAAGYMRGSPQREFCFFTESFVDELARRLGLEPLAFRMTMLGGNGRLARCLQGAARIAQWDGGGPGSTMGIAGCSAFGSHIGLVAIASIGEDQRIKVQKMIAAVDCGRIVNSGLIAQQVEAGLIWALGQAIVPSPEWVAGMPRARPIGGVGLPRLADVPEIHVQIISSSDAPGGISGLGPAVLAPAVANAIFAGSGKRLRTLPFDLMSAA